jgi:hypothetical protein
MKPVDQMRTNRIEAASANITRLWRNGRIMSSEGRPETGAP